MIRTGGGTAQGASNIRHVGDDGLDSVALAFNLKRGRNKAIGKILEIERDGCLIPHTHA